MKVILPLVLIVIMSWAVFWIDPSETGSQISVAITSMLTLIAYRFAIDSQLPRLPYPDWTLRLAWPTIFQARA